VTGITQAQARARNISKTYGGVFVLNLIAAASLAIFIGPAGTWQFGLIAGLLTGLTFISVARRNVALMVLGLRAIWRYNR
jgi:hypothetical protein